MGKDERSRILGVAGPWVVGLRLGPKTLRLLLHFRRARVLVSASGMVETPRLQGEGRSVWSRSTFVKTIQEFFGKHLG
jgi:hypothetical protein